MKKRSHSNQFLKNYSSVSYITEVHAIAFVGVWCVCFFNPLLAAVANTKIISKPRNWSYLLYSLIPSFLLYLFIMWQENKKEMPVFAIWNTECAVSRTARGGEEEVGPSKAACVDTFLLTLMKLFNPLKREGWLQQEPPMTLLKAKACAQADVFTETQHFNQSSCNHADLFFFFFFYSNQAAQRRWPGEQRQQRFWRRHTQIMAP